MRNLSVREVYILKWAFTKGFTKWFFGDYMLLEAYRRKREDSGDIALLAEVALLLHKLFGKPEVPKYVYRLITSKKEFSVGVPINVKHIYSLNSWADDIVGLSKFTQAAQINLKDHAYILVTSGKSVNIAFTLDYILKCLKTLGKEVAGVSYKDFYSRHKVFKKQHEVVCFSKTHVTVKAFAVPHYEQTYFGLHKGIEVLVQKFTKLHR